MRELFEDLRALIEKQITTVRNLNEAVERQIAALRRDDINDLNAALDEIGAHGVELARLEDMRLGLQTELEKALRLPADCSLRDLIPYAPPNVREPMTTLRNQLNDALRALREANAIAEVMSARALRLNAVMLGLLAGRSGETYGAEGNVERRSPTGSLDRSV